MRTHGTLAKWNEERGFGFIAPAQGSEELFVHVSAFPRDGTRPRVGELISFESEAGGDGRKRAIRVMRPGAATRPRRTPRRTAPASRGGPLAVIIGVLAVAVVGAYGYSTVTTARSAAMDAQVPPAVQKVAQVAPTVQVAPAALQVATVQAAQAVPATPRQPFACDGRTHCGQMTSCAEARYFLQNCPATEMDGNDDGEPCERQWCN